MEDAVSATPEGKERVEVGYGRLAEVVLRGSEQRQGPGPELHLHCRRPVRYPGLQAGFFEMTENGNCGERRASRQQSTPSGGRDISTGD